MKFALGLLQSRQGAEPESQIFQQTIERVQRAEELGFEAVWITEQHFNDFGVCPSPLTFLAHLAGLTSRIRLGTSVVVLSIQNPIRVAENAALVDQLSGGRLDLGIGKGHDQLNYQVFGTRSAENEGRFFEAHEVIKAAWSDNPFTYDGDFYQVERIPLVPRPVQTPHPPIWVASFGNPDTIRFAAENGYPLLPTFSGDSLDEKLGLYRHEFVGEGTPVISLIRTLHVRQEGEEARNDMRRPARWYLKNRPGSSPQTPINELAVERFLNDFGIIGSPEFCRDRIGALERDHNLDYLVCLFGAGGLVHEKTMASMEMFATEVMSEFTN